MNTNPKIGIIGCGRFGSFWRTQLEKKGHQVVWQTDKGDTVGCEADIVFICVPMRSFNEVCKELSQNLNEVCKELSQNFKCLSTAFKPIFIDVCSLKVFSNDIFKFYFSENCIGTHPLFGPQSAQGGLEGQKIAVCNVNASESILLEVSSFFNSLGLQVLHCSADYHDQQMAISQAFTHFLGRVGQRMSLKKIPLGTKSFDDLMDIIYLVQGSSEELFIDMQILNPYAKIIREHFLEQASLLHHILIKNENSTS